MSTANQLQSRGPLILLVLSLIAGALSMAGAGIAHGADSWKVQNKVFGKPKDSDGFEYKKSEDVSGLACATKASFPRICLIVDDESQGAQIVIMNDGELTAGQFIRLIYDVYDDKLLELDAEGVAYSDGFFYVIGSHGRPRHEEGDSEAKNNAKAQASRRIFRIRLDLDAVNTTHGTLKASPEIKPSSELSRLIKQQPELERSFGKALDDNGLTIEGVAVRAGVLYAGMRGPTLKDGKAVILSVPVAVLFDGLTGKTRPPLRVSLGKDTLGKPRGIRDLTVHGKRFLILAGPVNDPPEGHDIERGDYAIYSYDRARARATKLLDLEPYGKKVKPEALLPLDEKNGKLRALLLFDGPEEGEPRPIEIQTGRLTPAHAKSAISRQTQHYNTRRRS
jgi:Protein of unknown function (DUF3616)